MSEKIVALIPLRGGSKSIPKKNIKPLAGKPMCFWVLEAAFNSNYIGEVYVSTDSEEIASLVRNSFRQVRIIMRPDEYATDEASTELVILHFLENSEFDILVTIQATSPQLIGNDLDIALKQFIERKNDSMLSAVRNKRFFWTDDGNPINYDPRNRPRRQEFVGTYMENGAFYISRKKIVETEKCRLGGKVGIYEMNENTALEIDEPEDWDRMEKFLTGRNQ